MHQASRKTMSFETGVENPGAALWVTLDLLRSQVRDLVDDPTALAVGREEQVAEAIRDRALRSKHLDGELFSDPAWDMLLDLYRAELAQQRISITSACLASGVPTSTALRWLRILEGRGLIERRRDMLDGRRTFVGLTPAAVAAMSAYFDALAAA
jgi:DNA-binding MarR family transcriptional regulator